MKPEIQNVPVLPSATSFHSEPLLAWSLHTLWQNLMVIFNTVAIFYPDQKFNSWTQSSGLSSYKQLTDVVVGWGTKLYKSIKKTQ
jgi:hypothetical protein